MPPVRLERDGDVAELILDAPPLNLFDAAVFDALESTVAEVEATPPRALLLRAEGKVFSAGVDVHLFAGLDAAAADALYEAERLYDRGVVNLVVEGDELLPAAAASPVRAAERWSRFFNTVPARRISPASEVSVSIPPVHLR